MAQKNIFMKTTDYNYNTNTKTIQTKDLGYLPENELHEYAKLLRNTDFTSGSCFCMRKITPVVINDNGNIRLDLIAHVDVHSLHKPCGYAIYPSDCPYAIGRGWCHHPLVEKVIAKKFYPTIYSKEYQKTI